ncbi:hypothetical protein LINGRAHAP2_LOCUS22540 [Linum grandiflorum]
MLCTHIMKTKSKPYGQVIFLVVIILGFGVESAKCRTILLEPEIHQEVPPHCSKASAVGNFRYPPGRGMKPTHRICRSTSPPGGHG